MIRLAVFGQPVTQSLSPRIHAAFARQLGLDVEYTAIEATAETFNSQVGDLARRGGRGCNVTVPFKRAAWRLATVASDSANRAEAANTLVFTDRGWLADNTDGAGLVDDLEGRLAVAIATRRVCLLGAGGAAGGVLAALLARRPEQVVIANRTKHKAEDLAARHADLGTTRAAGLDELGNCGRFDLLINATSLGHGGSAPTLPTGLAADGGFCYDMNYGKAARPLRDACLERGLAYADGLGMLVGQAALSFRIWTGKMPDVEPVLESLRIAAGK